MECDRIPDWANSFQAFMGVTGKVVFSGSNLMFFLVKVKRSQVVPEHSHPNEQMGICLSGRAEFSASGETRVVDAGTVYWFRPNERHSVRALSDGDAVFLDVFGPPREDYLRRAKG
jgi:quercetin dioxygenase-like cupin family protein